MKKTICRFFLVCCLLNLVSNANCQERYQANWESLSKYQTPDWFRDAKFGIFIHWGVYSVPAYGSEWYPRNMYDTTSDEFKHHVATYGPQDKFGYKDFIPMFRAEKFDPAQWVSLFKKAGAKYIVPVAEHHDGFAMYNTALSRWNAFNMGPKRDIIGELAKEIRRQGLIFGLSSHRIEHWFFLNHGREFKSDVLNPEFADFYGPARLENETMTPEYMNDWLLRCTELVNNYQPQLFWFDWWIQQPALEPYRKSFAAFYYNKGLQWNKDVVINYKYDRSFPQGVAVLDLERGKLDSVRQLPWQTDDAIGNKSWGYIKDNTFKSARYVVTNLIDIVSKNGNLLLNIGPRSDGTITDEETQVLLETGKWLDVNGDAIYGTRPWRVHGEGPTRSASGSFADQTIPFNAKDIRFTTKGDTLFVITLGLPAEKTIVKSLGSKLNPGTIEAVSLMGSTEKIIWSQHSEGLVINPSSNYPSEIAAVYKIIFKK